MPYIKSISIHNTVNKSIAYILNPKKTEGMLLTTSINCTTDPEDAYLQMKMIYEHYSRRSYDEPINKTGKSSVKAIHYIMSFADSENVTPEYAFKVAKAFVRKTFGDDAQAVIAVHTDTDHTHCHVILNTYSISGRRYYDNQTTLRYVREHGNGVCRALGITPALNFEGKGRSMYYNEWEHRKNGTSWKQRIREEIDRLIPEVKSLDELLQVLEEHGYEIKRGKYISIKAPGQQRAVRTKTLGEEYTEESLITRIQYLEVGTGITPANDISSDLRAAYDAILSNSCIPAEPSERQSNDTSGTALSRENDLDAYRLSAQMAVMNKFKIHALGELEGMMNEQKYRYEKYRAEINQNIEEYNKMVSLIEQAETYYALAKKSELTPSEQLQMSVCRQTMLNNHLLTQADIDTLRDRAANMSKKIAALKESLENRRQHYEVFRDILETYERQRNEDRTDDRAEETELRKDPEIKKKRKRR